MVVKGVSFHVGSGATDPEAFREAIKLARDAFDAGAGVHRIHFVTSLPVGPKPRCVICQLKPATALLAACGRHHVFHLYD